MDTHFSSVIFKNIVGKPVIFEDFEMIDPSMYMAMKKLLEMDSETIEIMDMNFAAEVNDFDGNNIVPLVQDGENIKVTYENKYTFVDYYSRWKLVESVRPQLERLLSGVYDIIPREYFAIFNEKELELLLCGSPEIDLDDWKSNTRYEGGYTAESPSIVHFWEAVEEMNHTHRSKLLQFVTGTSSIPHEGFEGIFPAFTICMLRNMSQDFLPHAHTWYVYWQKQSNRYDNFAVWIGLIFHHMKPRRFSRRDLNRRSNMVCLALVPRSWYYATRGTN